MSILKELLGLSDPDMLFEANVPIELADIVKYFPKHHGKALEKLWGGNRLVWHGKRFFDDDGLGAAYTEAVEAAKAYVEDGYNTDVNLDIHGEVDGKEFHDTMSWDVEFDLDDGQECYLGYDPKKDALYIGFDVGTKNGDDEFNQAFDKTFEDATGALYDEENPEHEQIFSAAWKKYNSSNYGFWGLLFEINIDSNGNMTAEEAFQSMPGGFYKELFKIFKRSHPSIIDLRLD